MIIGTVPYMSPEQLQGESVDHRTDLFSLGIMLYEMATGQRPFQGKNSATITSSILRDTPRPLHELNGVLPRHLGRIIEHCLEKNAEERFQSAKDIRNELRALRKEVDSGSDLSETQSVSATAVAPLPRSSTALALPSGSAMSAPTRRGEFWIGVGVVSVIIVLAAIWLGRGGSVSEETAATNAPSRKALSTPGKSDPTQTETEQPDLRTTLAILPFKDHSPKPEEWLATGLADAISTRLGRVNPSKLGVLGPETTTYYAQAGNPIRDLSEDLNVAFVLRGSIQVIGNDVRIMARLIRADDLTSVWSDEFKGTMDDPFALQSMVADKIVAGLPFKLTGQEKRRLRKRYTENQAAELAYMKGRFFGSWEAGGEKQLSIAVSHFERAIEIDPNYALPYCGLVDTKCFQATWGTLQTSKIRSEMVNTVARVLALDDTLAEAHVSAALVAMYINWDWPEAEAKFERAIQLNPNLAGTYLDYGHLLVFVGRYDEAEKLFKEAIRLDPLSSGHLSGLGMLYAGLGRLNEAEALLEQAYVFNKDNVDATFWLADVRQKQGRFDDAVEIMERSVSSMEHPELARLCFLGNAYAMAGRMDDARKQLAKMHKFKGDLPAHHMWFGEMHVALGEKDEAFRRLDQALAAREAWLPHIRFDPGLISIRSDPRFAELHRKMGLGHVDLSYASKSVSTASD